MLLPTKQDYITLCTHLVAQLEAVGVGTLRLGAVLHLLLSGIDLLRTAILSPTNLPVMAFIMLGSLLSSLYPLIVLLVFTRGGVVEVFEWAEKKAPSEPLPEEAAQRRERWAWLFPYRNPDALMSGHLGILSIVMCCVPLPAIGAIWLGVKGIRFAKQNPLAGGKVHAWVGVVLGTLSLLVALLLLFMIWGQAIFVSQTAGDFKR